MRNILADDEQKKKKPQKKHISPTISVGVHLPEDLLGPLLRCGLILRHLHHRGHHFVDGLQRQVAGSIPEVPNRDHKPTFKY